MYLKVYPDNPAPRHIDQVTETIKNGGLVIYPTDTVYAVGCDLYNTKAIENLCKLVGKKPEEAKLSMIFSDLSTISDYTLPFDKGVFKAMKKSFPGPYTFILNSSSKVPKIFKNKRKEIGVRIPNNLIPTKVVEALGSPMISASLHDDDDIIQYPTDPEEIYEKYK
ncbi:MAG: threonylcarbamoyl-AMP synthase, partial [Bacteroidetes bacterium SW_10_40_5]